MAAKTKRIKVSVTTALYKILKQKSGQLGISLTDYVRYVLVKHLEDYAPKTTASTSTTRPNKKENSTSSDDAPQTDSDLTSQINSILKQLDNL